MALTVTHVKVSTVADDVSQPDQIQPSDWGSTATVGPTHVLAGSLDPADVTGTAVVISDVRLSDARVPLAHTQAWSTITATPTTLAGYGIADAVVLTSDARLSDARIPLAHTQAFSTITSTPTSLAGYGILDAVVLATRTVNGHALSADVTVSKSDVGLGNVENTALSTWAGSTALTTIGQLTTLKVGGASPPAGIEGYFASSSAADPRGVMSAQYSSDAVGARIHLRKARNTEASPAIVVTADVLGRIRFSGYDGANYLQMASIDAVATGTIAATRVPTYLAFSVATDAAPSVLTEVLRLTAVGTGGQLLASNGTAAAPSYSFASDPDTGLLVLAGGTGYLGIVSQGTTYVGLTGGASWQMKSDVNLGWSPSTWSAAASDLSLFRDAADTLAQRRGTNPQTFRLYNTYTDASNYERLNLYWTSNIALVETSALGTGTARALNIGTAGAAPLNLRTNGANRWQVGDTTGHLFAVTDNTYDIGASAATRPRTGYFGTSVVAPFHNTPASSVLTITANVIAPTGSVHHVGAGLIKTITVPAGLTPTGRITIIPDAAFTYDATGNIVVPAGGGTALINKTMTFTWDGAKWTPNY